MSDAPVPLDAGTDPQALFAGLIEGVHRALGPAAPLEVERKRTLADRLAGRPGVVELLRLEGPRGAMTLKVDGHGRLAGEAARISGGVVISRRTLPLGEWLMVFSGQVAAGAAEAAGDAAAAARAFTALGLQPAGADLAVPAADVENGLLALTARAEGRVPDPALEAVRRIVELLRDTLPRVAGSGEPEVVVRRTATVYLPDTLRAYVALPVEWATTHTMTDGRTPADALLAQLQALLAAAERMRDSALAQDATALEVNGRFLTDRFAISDLDLPR